MPHDGVRRAPAQVVAEQVTDIAHAAQDLFIGLAQRVATGEQQHAERDVVGDDRPREGAAHVAFMGQRAVRALVAPRVADPQRLSGKTNPSRQAGVGAANSRW